MSSFANVPSGKKLWGANVVCKKSDVDTGYPWPSFWENWDWSGWIKPQIDYLIGNGVGVNVIRVIGALGTGPGGTLTQAAYNARAQQLADYLGSNGVHLYACGGGWQEIGSMTNTQVADNISGMLLAIQSRSNVIGCDVLQENNGWTASGAVSNSIAIASAIKSAGVTLPLTFSTYEYWNDSTCRSWVTSMASALDFLDFHVYVAGGYPSGVPVVASDLNYWRTNYPSLEIICGEYGWPNSDTTDGDTYAWSLLKVFNSGDPAVVGALMWAGFDQDTSSGNQWGMYDGPAGNKRLQRALPVAAMTGGYPRRRN